ncbi:MAG: tetratricopeptide repeat protein [Lentisphaerae bacterium]|nr:tetratricopeptide repeat protein [Lentisphaerota bacterium]
MKEKTLKDVHAGIREFYTRAVDFERKENWEFAISCMLEAVMRVPAFSEARQKLRSYEKQFTKKFKSLQFSVQVKTYFAMGKIKKLTKTSPLDAVNECEKLLALNLNNPQILQALADAALKADASAIAIDALQVLHDYQPNNVAVMRKLAACYRADGQAQEALKVYQYLASKNPKDKKIQNELREASAFATQQKTAWEKESLASHGKSVKDDALTIQLAEGTLRDADHAKTLIKLYTKELAEKDSDEMRKKLAEAYIVIGDYDKAIENLEIVAGNLPALDPTLDKQIERTYLAKYNLIVDELRKKAAADPSLRGNLQEAEDFLMEFRIEKAEARSRAYPVEAALHFDLASIYADAKRYDDAARELAEASKSPQRRTQSLALLGRCACEQGKYEEAIQYCDEALTEMVRMDRHKFAVMYDRASSLAALNRNDEALAAFQEIYRNNAKFKDVAERIKTLGGEA